MCDKPLAILLPTVGMPHLLLKNPVENKTNKKSWILSNAFDSGILSKKYTDHCHYMFLFLCLLLRKDNHIEHAMIYSNPKKKKKKKKKKLHTLRETSINFKLFISS